MRLWFIQIALVVLTAGSAGALDLSADRDRDPVVMSGTALTSLIGLPPEEVVAFRYAGTWQQIPVQIDERKIVDYGVVYNDDPIGVTTLSYTDATTYTGADTDLMFDTDDELVFMAGDAGVPAGTGAGYPSGVLTSPAVEVTITDSLDGGTETVYLFRSAGILTPDAGQDYVTYTFDLLAGSYIPNYKTTAGPNPEDSEAFSPYYRTHFSDRWICDELNVYAGGSSGVDILDRHKNLFAPGVCGRSEDTFSAGEGAFFVNKDGPVRAIRSYMGANSGPLTQREHLFYEQRQDSTTFLRVHAIPAVMDFYDYSPAASGLVYYNSLNLGGVVINGVPDTVTAGSIVWEMVTGSQGSVVVADQVETDISPFSYTSYYSDDTTPSYTQCTGDAYEYGSSGVFVNQSIPNTDPRQPPFNNMTSRRIIYYEAPGQTTATAATRYAQAGAPLAAVAAPYTPTPVDADLDQDGDVDGFDFLTFSNCFNGSNCPPLSACENQGADLDSDDDVDGFDFLTFSNCFNGSNRPPLCS